jgi:hypothetical protein
MRILALLFGVIAVTVWWAPLPRLAQSLTLALLCVSLLALRSAHNRLDVAHKAVTEVQETMRTIRVAAAPKGQDPEGSP